MFGRAFQADGPACPKGGMYPGARTLTSGPKRTGTDHESRTTDRLTNHIMIHSALRAKQEQHQLLTGGAVNYKPRLWLTKIWVLTAGAGGCSYTVRRRQVNAFFHAIHKTLHRERLYTMCALHVIMHTYIHMYVMLLTSAMKNLRRSIWYVRPLNSATSSIKSNHS